jgi:hypothetical protein
MQPIEMAALFSLQCFHVLFLALHAWVSLGTLNDVKAVRVANPRPKLFAVTLDQPHSLCDRTSRQRHLPWQSLFRRGCSGGSGSATAFYSSAS